MGAGLHRSFTCAAWVPRSGSISCDFWGPASGPGPPRAENLFLRKHLALYTNGGSLLGAPRNPIRLALVLLAPVLRLARGVDRSSSRRPSFVAPERLSVPSGTGELGLGGRASRRTSQRPDHRGWLAAIRRGARSGSPLNCS